MAHDLWIGLAADRGRENADKQDRDDKTIGQFLPLVFLVRPKMGMRALITSFEIG